jgi:hypothetical protein
VAAGGGAGGSDGDYTLRRRERSQHLQKVGEYMLGDLVGEGGYAKVKSGFSAVTGERIAAKIMQNTNSAATTHHLPLFVRPCCTLRLGGTGEEHKREILTMSALKVCSRLEVPISATATLMLRCGRACDASDSTRTLLN